ncbi:hypothetical protein CK203_062770 [Vitis vinifera]|uniref:Uncharacterized protein n=1 Tax=Vitis vinifera TaxID=29760 RepID=A0A438GB40_VITVI|nr:hypothetical protein CK203_062770 [Vitis vinifera]
MARTRGAKSSSPSNRKRVCERSQFQNLSRAFAVKPNPPPVKPATKAAGKTIPYQVRQSAIAEETQGGELRTIDLTEQSPEPSQFHHRFKLQCRLRFPRQSPANSIAGTISGTPRKISGASSATSEPQIQLNSSGRTFRVRPELAQSFQLLRRYHMEHLLAPRIFSIPDSHGFLPVHDNQRVESNLIHFIIDGDMVFWEQDILLKPCKFLLSQPNSTILKLGQILLTLDPKKGSSLEALYKMSEGFFFGPHHLIMAALLYFEEKVHKKKLQRADCIPSSSQGCYAKFWSISDTPLSLSWRKSEYASSTSCTCSSQPSTSAEPRMAILYLNIEIVPCIGDSYSFSEQSCSGDGSHQSMPGADVSLSGSTSCHPKAASSPFRSATSCRALHYSTRATLSAFRVSSSRAQAPADPPTEEADPSA